MNKPETQATLYVVGNLNVDLIMSTLHQWPKKGTEAMLESSALRPGGSAGNCALALAALGTPHRLVVNQGNDQFTEWLASLFPESAPHWPTVNCETSLTFGVTHPDHERTFFSNQGHIVRLNLDDVLRQLPTQATAGDWVLLCGTFLCTRLFQQYDSLLKTLKQRGYQVAVDSGWPPQDWSDALRHQIEPWLGYCDALLLNEVETLGMANGQTLDVSATYLLKCMARNAFVVAKCGSDGARLWSAGHQWHQTADAVAVVDTIGAGDSFNAGFLSALVYGLDHRRALQWGVRVAGAAISSSPRQYPDWQALVSLGAEDQ
ncbi:carbohydrate kinase family protein [Hafnia psychrotolerans]|jgi:sugar/nucleoside kinase (ribokinase family)|uniref:Carbohydrate kinase n=1 Tax=Hafnia psychrotolerans TaxID=1477018 RepID=A0ABQ1GRT7_9GAMM|nr:carbohydrate kinase family protein [Hafnia psychrotolerans]GGA49168.1 carbohydrate kinase [Hafnia psychrotolerans]